MWGTSNAGGSYARGKVVEAVRHNWIPANPTTLVDYAVRERYEYRGRLGQISARETALESDRPYSPTMRQTWTYDGLGRVTQIGYPTCVPDDLGQTACADGGDALPPTFTSTWEYDGGLPTRVSSYYGVDARFTYHPNLQIARATFWNGTSGIFDQGTNGMARPARLQLKRGTLPIFDSGVYTFDGMGNIATIGNDAYTYDLQGRLLSATVKKAGFNRREDYTYDLFDNPTGTSRDGGMWQQWSIDAKNRILGPAGRPTDIFYDDAGNMERVGFLADGVTPVWELSYDALGLQWRYHRYTDGKEFADTIYVYGPGDLRLLEFDGVTTVRRMMYRDLDGSILREFEVQNWGLYQGPGQNSEVWTHVKDFLHGPQGLFHTRERTGGNRFFFADHLGTPRVLTTGFTSTPRHYYPYGADVTSSSEDERLYKYTGHSRDPDNVTDYMRARTYVYPILRFSSVDPGRDGWNLYAYVGDNPVNAVDPDGRDGIIASAEDIDTLWSASLRSSMVGGVTGKFGPGSGRTLFLERGDPGVHSNGLPLEGKADVTFGREASSEAMVQAYDAAGGGAAGEAAAEAIYSAAANDVSSATITLAPAAGDGVMLHEVGHLDQALREPEKFKEQTAEAAGARTSREYRASASEKYAEKFRREARRKDRREESQ